MLQKTTGPQKVIVVFALHETKKNQSDSHCIKAMSRGRWDSTHFEWETQIMFISESASYTQKMPSKLNPAYLPFWKTIGF